MSSQASSHPRLPRIRRAAKGVVRTTYRHGLWCVPTRNEIPEVLNRRGLLGTGVEVGVGWGDYSAMLLERWRGETLISVDHWGPTDESLAWVQSPPEKFVEAHEGAVKALAPFGSRSVIWKMKSVEAAAQTPLRSLDFVYIDAWHEYESVCQDIRLWEDKVRPGGLLCGHDYRDGVIGPYPYGVESAVNEFCEERGLRLALTRRPNESKSWLIEMP